jgi:molecular chaperone DnaJ
MNPYEVLGIPRDAQDGVVKKAYHKLAREHHPDKGGDAEKFKKVQEAYEILTDPQKRENFDRFGTPEGPPQGGNPFPPDIFAQMFGGFGGGQRGPVKRSNFDHEIKISLEESYRGTVKNLRVTLEKTCFSCKKKCQQCHGRGQVQHHMGPMVFNQPCNMCGGEGGVSHGCGECHRGKKKEPLNLELKIPAGIESGAVMTGHGLGEQPRNQGEEPGDVNFHIKIDDHPELMRQGMDIVWSTKIPFVESVNGKKIKIPHFDGPIEIDTTDWGVLDPREDYLILGKGFVPGGKLRVSFNVVYPPVHVKFNLSKLT